MTKRVLTYLLTVLLLLFAGGTQLAHAATPEYDSWDDLDGKRIAMITGAPFEEAVREKNPNIDSVSYYSSTPDMLLALQTNKTDACVANLAVGTLAVNRNPDLALFPSPLTQSQVGVAFPKTSAYTSSFVEVFERFEQDGTADELWDKWLSADESGKVVLEQDWPGAAGTLRIAACSSLEPSCYLGENGIMGFDADILLHAARELDLHVQFLPMEFSEILASIEAGKADAGIGSIFITEERLQTVDFAVEHENNMVLIVRASDAAEQAGSLPERIALSFRKTFIDENRWQLICQGLGITLLISVASGVLGVALGYLTVRMSWNRPHIADIFRAFRTLMGRLPIVVVLMVFYYVVFGAIDIPGVVVAIVVFTLSFCASSGGIMSNAVEAVAKGQTEASLALGFDDTETFTDVVLPQAAKRFIPLLQSQFVSLVKETAVVGYIAVIDLTRAGDIIRSRTMEAMFPLLVTALIYFALCSLLVAVMDAVNRRSARDSGPRTIPGVRL